MTFSEWFDPYDFDHILAYDHLQKTGFWPEGFIPEDLEGQPHFFQIEAMALLAKSRVELAKISNHYKE